MTYSDPHRIQDAVDNMLAYGYVQRRPYAQPAVHGLMLATGFWRIGQPVTPDGFCPQELRC